MSDCSCDICKRGCTYKPGWFMPGEPEKVAEYLNLSLQELFDTKLGVDWWVGDDQDTFLLAPAVLNMQAGQEYPADPHGQCVFYKNGLCSIHPVKPYECREYLHDEDDVVYNRHESVAHAWENHQAQIEELLGREPYGKDYEGFFSDPF